MKLPTTNTTQTKQPMDKWERKDLEIQVAQAMNLAQNDIHNMERVNGKLNDRTAVEVLLETRTTFYFNFLTTMKKKLIDGE